MNDNAKKKSAKHMVLELGDAIRVAVPDGVPSLEVFDTYMAEQEQAEPWQAIAVGAEVLPMLEELRRFVEEHAEPSGKD